MPRLKLPKPAKRHERRLKHAAAIGKQHPHANRTLIASMAYAKGYDHAVRDIHGSRNIEERNRRRNSWRRFTANLEETNRLRAKITELEKQLAAANAPDMPVSPGGTD